MSIQNAIRAVAGSRRHAREAWLGWDAAADALQQVGVDSDARRAHLIGQCAHESGGFRRRIENLNYSAARLEEIFSKYFKPSECAAFARQPQKIANRVYADRIGNGDEASGDGWAYRGRGWIQLTGRDNYRVYGGRIGVDLESDPAAAEDPARAWLIAAVYMADRRRGGKTLLEWADLGEDEEVTRGVNGGMHGYDDRVLKVSEAASALGGEPSTAEWQRLLADNGFNPGPIDGLLGPKTLAAMELASRRFGLMGIALAEELRMAVAV